MQGHEVAPAIGQTICPPTRGIRVLASRNLDRQRDLRR